MNRFLEGNNFKIKIKRYEIKNHTNIISKSK